MGRRGCAVHASRSHPAGSYARRTGIGTWDGRTAILKTVVAPTPGAIGLVSSIIGVASSELIIPTLVFGFGMDIKLARTARLLVSLPKMGVGVARYARGGAYTGRRDLVETVAPMGVGSVIGAVLGGLLVGIVPTAVPKVELGCILIGSAIRISRHTGGH